MKEYNYRPTIDWVVNSLLKDFAINKDYIIAGGFIRDSAMGLGPKDIDIFVRDGVTDSELDWELLTRDIPEFQQSKILDGDMGQYGPTPVPPVLFDDLLYPFNTTLTKEVQTAEPKDSVQELRGIIKVEELLYNSSLYPINFIHCKITKGFTPQNLVNTFDCNLVQGYINDDLSLELPKDFEKACEKKIATIYHNDSPSCVSKSVDRFLYWASRHRQLKSWKYDVVDPKKSLMDRVTSPYKDFIKRNGKPFKNEQLKAYASAMPLR